MNINFNVYNRNPAPYNEYSIMNASFSNFRPHHNLLWLPSPFYVIIKCRKMVLTCDGWPYFITQTQRYWCGIRKNAAKIQMIGLLHRFNFWAVLVKLDFCPYCMAADLSKNSEISRFPNLRNLEISWITWRFLGYCNMINNFLRNLEIPSCLEYRNRFHIRVKGVYFAFYTMKMCHDGSSYVLAVHILY